MTTPTSPRSPDEVRQVVLAVLHTIAPDSDVATLRPDRPLHEQLELDSLDWMNVAAALAQRLGVAPEADVLAARGTLDELVARLAAAPRAAASAPAAPPAARRHRLDGIELTVRPIRREDMAMEAAFVQRLSDQSRYQRFMGTVRELPEAKLRYLTEVDGVKHVALVATTVREGNEVELGVARYVVDASGRGCEFAIAVDDAWQHSGLAGLLMAELIATARSRGIERMDGSVLASNLAMLHFARQLGFEVQADPGDATTRRVTRRL